MIYVISSPRFPPAAGERLEAFRRRHAPPDTPFLPAHLTLVFGRAASALESLRLRVAVLAAATCCFDAEFTGLEIFHWPPQGRFHLFLVVGAGADRFAAMHRDLNREVPPAGAAVPPFQPHVTLAVADNAAAIERLREQAQEMQLPIPARFESLELLQLQSGQLQRLDGFSFASRRAPQGAA